MNLRSISPISRIIPTSGSNPALVLCEDISEYYCKYSRRVPANKLMIEFLAASFLQIWNIPTPSFEIIEILPEHVPTSIYSNRVSPADFIIPTFGSKQLSTSQEIDESIILSWKNNDRQLKKINNKNDILKIGLFDLWLANEDRNFNNYNLMINADKTGNVIYAIDQEKCFNSGIFSFSRPIQPLAFEETIFNTPLIPLFYKNKMLTENFILGFLTEFPIFAASCRSRLPAILQQLPSSWSINTDEIRTLLEENIFKQDWIHQTNQLFREYLNNNGRS